MLEFRSESTCYLHAVVVSSLYYSTLASVWRVLNPPSSGRPGTSSLVMPARLLSNSMASTPCVNFPNSAKASSNLSKSDASDEPFSLFQSELEAELSLSDSVELSSSTLVSPETIPTSCAGWSGSLLRLARFAGGSSDTQIGVRLKRLALDCSTTRLGWMSASEMSSASAAAAPRNSFLQTSPRHQRNVPNQSAPYTRQLQDQNTSL